MKTTSKLGLFSKSFKAVDVLLHIYYKENIIARRIATDLNITFCYTVKIIKELEKSELVNGNIKGRKKELTLTEKGKEVAAKFEEIKNLMKQ